MRKSINWKTQCFFCGGVCVVDKRHHNGSKGWHKVDVFLSFQTSILNKCYERAEKCSDDVFRRFSSSIDVGASDTIYHEQSESIFFYEKCISTTNGTKSEHTVGHTADNNKIKFWNIMQMNWWTNRNVYSEWASCKNVFICRKRSMC